MYRNRVVVMTVLLLVLLAMETCCTYGMKTEPTLKRERRVPFRREYDYDSSDVNIDSGYLYGTSDEDDYRHHNSEFFESEEGRSDALAPFLDVDSSTPSAEDTSSTTIPTPNSTTLPITNSTTTLPTPPSTTTTTEPSTTTPEPSLSQLHWLLLEEARRHPWRGMDHAPPALKKAMQAYKNSGFEKFCAEAHHRDNPPLRVEDGGFHPKYEIVPGVGLYRFHASPLAWQDAREVCEKEGAQLAVVNYLEEARVLAEIHNRCPFIIPSHFNDYQYLGVHDIYQEGSWETVAGYPLNDIGYVRWGFGQPDNAHHNGENCLAMNRYGFFNDVPCWMELPFSCEHP